MHMEDVFTPESSERCRDKETGTKRKIWPQELESHGQGDTNSEITNKL